MLRWPFAAHDGFLCRTALGGGQREPRNLAFCVRPTRHVRYDGAIIQPQRPLPSFQPIALTDTGCASVASPSRRWSAKRSLCRIGWLEAANACAYRRRP